MEYALSFVRSGAVPSDCSSLTTLRSPFHSRAIISVPSGDPPPFRSGMVKAISAKGFRPLHAASAAGVDEIGFVAVEEGRRSSSPVIVIDNYDSFTYNLCQYLGELGADFEVYRNDELTVDEIKRKNPRGILISPGPGKIVRSPYGVMHGKGSLVYYDEKGEDGLLAGLSNPFTAGRYHSLVIENESFPKDMLEITARTEDGLVMAVRHKRYKHIQGVQFHPESIITSEGKTIVRNFLKLIEKREKESE